MVGLSSLLNFSWISPRRTHDARTQKAELSSPEKEKLRPAVVQAAARRAARRHARDHVTAAATTNGTGRPQAATGNVRRGSERTSGGIPWEQRPPSSPVLVQTIEEGLAKTGFASEEEDEVVEDEGDEGAIDEMSGEDDSEMVDVDDEECEEDEDEEEEEDERGDSDDDYVDGEDEDVEIRTEENGEENEEAQSEVEVKQGGIHEETDQPESEQETVEPADASGGDGQPDDEDRLFDANENTKLINLEEDHEAALRAATHQFAVDRDEKLRQQREDARGFLHDGWHPDTIELYMLIDRRTMEPLMPSHWDSDFPLFPWSVFTNIYEDAYLGGMQPNNDFIMIRATRDLLKLPAHVRNQIRIRAWHGRRAEAMVVKYCEDYQKLIHKDGKLWFALRKRKLHSLIVYAAGDERTGVDKLEELVLRRLRKRAQKILDLLRVTDNSQPSPVKSEDADTPRPFTHEGESYIYEPPTLYGILAKEAVVALVAYEPLSSRDKLRPIAFFHLSKLTYDVWNSLALAVLMIYCRDHLLGISRAIKLWRGEDLEECVMSDVDEDEV